MAFADFLLEIAKLQDVPAKQCQRFAGNCAGLDCLRVEVTLKPRAAVRRIQPPGGGIGTSTFVVLPPEETFRSKSPLTVAVIEKLPSTLFAVVDPIIVPSCKRSTSAPAEAEPVTVT